MMTRLAIHLLGTPRVERDGEALHIARRKALALLAYLVVEPGRHQRDALATRVWPEFDQRAARAELSRALWTLNRALGKGRLSADRETVALDPETEAEICQTLRGLRGQLTILAISHQAALVEVADRVFRISEGNITLMPANMNKDKSVASQ